MELVLRYKPTVLELLPARFRKKNENIYFEEGIIKPGEALKTVLGKISEEAGILSEGTTLIIIDKHFTAIKCKEATHKATVFSAWIGEHRVSKVIIYTKIQENCFERTLLELLDKCIELRPIPEIIHDRYWIFCEDGFYTALSVGTSFNGLGKRQFCLVTKLSDEDKGKLFKELAASGILL